MVANKTAVRPVNMGGQHAGMDAQIISVYNEDYGILIEMQSGRSQHKTHALIMTLMELAIAEASK
jgi:protein subunit release factor A